MGQFKDKFKNLADAPVYALDSQPRDPETGVVVATPEPVATPTPTPVSYQQGDASVFALPPEPYRGMGPKPPPTATPQTQQQTPQEQPPAPGAQSYDMTPQVLGLHYVPGTTPRLTEGDNRILDSQGRQAQIARDALDATTKANDEAQRVYRQAVDDDEQRIAAIERVQADSDREHSLRLTEIDDKIKTLPPVTPKSFGELWANTDTGGKILAGIGLALSVLGKAGTTASIIDGAIERDVRKQQALYEASKENIGLMRQAFGDRSKMYDDRLDSMDKLRIISWEKYKRLLQGYEAKVQGEEQKAKLGNLVEQANQQQELARQNMWARAQKRAAGRVEAIVGIGNQRMGMPVDKAYKLAGSVQKQNIDQQELDLRRRKFEAEEEEASPEIPGLRKTGEKSPKLRGSMSSDLVKMAGNYSWALDMMRQAKELAAKGTNWSDEDRIKAQNLRNDLVDGRLQGRGYGVPSASEFARIEKVITDPLNLTKFWERNSKRYEILEQVTRNEANQKFRPYGYALEGSASRVVKPISRDDSNRVYKAK